MGVPKVLIASVVLFSLVFSGVWADAGVEDGDLVDPQKASNEALKLELEHLRSRISNLESSISDQSHELKSKDESIALLEKVIEDKLGTISLLQIEIESIQKKGAVDAEELVAKARARVADLEKQVEKLRNDIELENRKRDALEVRAREAEKKLEEINLKIESLQKTNDEQKRRIKKTERALQVAEEELMRVQLEATSKSKELTEDMMLENVTKPALTLFNVLPSSPRITKMRPTVHGAWLPPWLATQFGYCQEITSIYWKEHGRPVLNVFVEKVSEKSAQAQKFFEPHVEKAKTEWLPAVRERWVIFLTNAEPIVERVHTRIVDLYDALNNNLAPHVAKVQELADPHYQKAKKFSKPYIDQIALVTEPHVEKLQVILKPYKDHVVRGYGKFLKSVTTYHHQVQAGIHEHLKKFDLTKSLATKELVWFMASAFLALPIFLVYRLLSDIFWGKRTGKPTQHSHANHGHHRRHKRRHADK